MAITYVATVHGRFQDFWLERAAYWEGAGWSPKCGPICFEILVDWGGGTALWLPPWNRPCHCIATTYIATTYIATTYIATTYFATTYFATTYIATTYIATAYIATTYIATTYFAATYLATT